MPCGKRRSLQIWETVVPEWSLSSNFLLAAKATIWQWFQHVFFDLNMNKHAHCYLASAPKQTNHPPKPIVLGFISTAFPLSNPCFHSYFTGFSKIFRGWRHPSTLGIRSARHLKVSFLTNSLRTKPALISRYLGRRAEQPEGQQWVQRRGTRLCYWMLLVLRKSCRPCRPQKLWFLDVFRGCVSAKKKCPK